MLCVPGKVSPAHEALFALKMELGVRGEARQESIHCVAGRAIFEVGMELFGDMEQGPMVVVDCRQSYRVRFVPK